MAYTPQAWANGAAGNTPLSAERIYNLELGVAATGLGTTQSRTNVFQFEHPNSAPAIGPYNISTRRLCSFTHASAEKGFRIHVKNRNFLGDAWALGDMSGFAMYFGEAALDASGEPTGQFAGTPMQVQASTTLVSGQELITSWIAPGTFQILPWKYYLLSYPVQVASGQQLAVGGGAHWYTANPADASAVAPSGLTRVENQGTLDIYFEYRIADDYAPSILVVSNSISNGGNTGNSAAAVNRAELSSWPVLWAKQTRGIAAHIGVGGGWCGHYTATSSKWDHYNTLDGGLAALDLDAIVIYALTSSDMTAGTAIATVKSALATTVAKARAIAPKAQIIITNNPARAETTAGALEATRNDLNRYLGNLPNGVQICLDVDSLVTDWGTTARPRTPFQGDPGVDLTHWSGRAHQNAANQLESTINRRVLWKV